MLALFAMKVDMVFFLQFIIMYALHFRVPLLKSGQRKRTERARIFIAQRGGNVNRDLIYDGNIWRFLLISLIFSCFLETQI